MSHQIYYTSAPEGIKRGASGFCTVAASENIPKALWDRLEALSAYRHHFPAGGGQQNPTSFAHWLLNVSGASYHVLSRICDSGVDHTQRTNAFAHHLVLEASEMAPAGPAWMLERGHVMAESWDGRVGTIPARNIPRSDAAPAICRQWEQLTGDAGWGGHLADIFIKSPSKPVCLLFAPGQNLLPLLAETIALLPPAARWNATFNTYFTSMPTSATCVWRCCLADTPAAQIGLRYAANGVVLDLTDRARLGKIPEGPYVTIARTGRPPAGVVRSVAAPLSSARPAAGVRSRPAAAASSSPAEKLDELDEFTPVPEPILEEMSADDTGVGMAPPPVVSQGPSLPTLPALKRPLVTRSNQMRLADAALRSAEDQASRAAAKRRKQVMVLFAGAIGALGIGTGIVMFLMRNTAPPELPPAVASRARPQSAPSPVYIAPAPAPTETVIVATAPAPTAQQDAIIIPAPPPTGSNAAASAAFIAPAAPKFPAIIQLTTPIDFPTPGAGVADRSQTLKFKAADLEPALALHPHFVFPGSGKNHYLFKGDLNGSLLARADRRANAVTLYWKDTSETDIVTLTFDQSHGAIDVSWKTGNMVKRPEIARATYWVLANSHLDLIGTGRGRDVQQIAMRPMEEPAFKLSDASAALFKDGEIPADVSIVPPAALPQGWQAAWYTEWDAKDAALRTPQNASQIIKFHKPGTTDAVESWFVIAIRPGFTKVESTFAKRLAADEADLAKYESDLRAINDDIEKMHSSGYKDTDPILKPYVAKKDETARLAAAYKAAALGYKDLTELDVSLELPDGLRLTTLHFRAPQKTDH